MSRECPAQEATSALHSTDILFRYLRDPVVVLVLAISFVLSVVLLHIIGKLARWFYK